MRMGAAQIQTGFFRLKDLFTVLQHEKLRELCSLADQSWNLANPMRTGLQYHRRGKFGPNHRYSKVSEAVHSKKERILYQFKSSKQMV